MRKRIANKTEALYGKEPEPSSFLEVSDPEYSTFFSGLMYYYSHAASKAQKKKWFLKYLTDCGKDATLADLLSKTHFVTCGCYARIWDRGLRNDAIKAKLDDLEKNILEEAEKMKEKLVIKNHIKDIKVKNESKGAINQIDMAIDDIITSNKVFDINRWVHDQNITSDILKAINLKFKKLREEIAESFTNPELIEAYSNLKKKQKTLILNLLNGLVAFNESGNKVRKTRKKYKTRTKDPKKVVAKVKYQSEFKYDKTNIVKSLSPTAVIGSDSFWFFNTKYRTLTFLKAKDAAGLNIKGSTVININIKESQAKKIRKPETIIPEVLTGGKVKLRHIFDTLTTRDSKVTGRIGSDTILLRIG